MNKIMMKPAQCLKIFWSVVAAPLHGFSVMKMKPLFIATSLASLVDIGALALITLENEVLVVRFESETSSNSGRTESRRCHRLSTEGSLGLLHRIVLF